MGSGSTVHESPLVLFCVRPREKNTSMIMYSYSPPSVPDKSTQSKDNQPNRVKCSREQLNMCIRNNDSWDNVTLRKNLYFKQFLNKDQNRSLLNPIWKTHVTKVKLHFLLAYYSFTLLISYKYMFF